MHNDKEEGIVKRHVQREIERESTPELERKIRKKRYKRAIPPIQIQAI